MEKRCISLPEVFPVEKMKLCLNISDFLKMKYVWLWAVP